MINYQGFIDRKGLVARPSGFECGDLSPSLFDFQRDITRWALALGKAAIFAGTGLGKTLMQSEWAHRVHEYTGEPILLVAPLAVSHQTVREAARFGIEINPCKTEDDAGEALNITNYERIDRFSLENFAGIVLDESSILKSHDGATRAALIEAARSVPFRLACTATPAPNDFMELGNHAEFLGVMTRAEMLSMFFLHDGGETQKWRLKGHAEEAFWKWIASWAVMFENPSDLGYDGSRFMLPALEMHPVTVDAQSIPEGMLFAVEAQTLQERQRARKDSTDDRVRACAEIVNGDVSEQWILWCNLNAEGDALTRAIPGAVQVAGSDSDENKEQRIIAFTEGRIRVLVSKPSICGFGLNWQGCARIAFVGLSDSFEQFYQAVRRCWRFGQERPVQCYTVTSSAEGAVVANLQRKEADAARMRHAMVAHMNVTSREALKSTKRQTTEYHPDKPMEVPAWLIAA